MGARDRGVKPPVERPDSLRDRACTPGRIAFFAGSFPSPTHFADPSMQLRALAHRSAALSLRDQHAAMTEHRVFTTRSQRPREHVDDPVEYLTDSDDERMPSLAEEACLVGDLSDCTDLEDGGMYSCLTVRCISPFPAGLSSPLSPCSPWDSEGACCAIVRTSCI